MKLLRRSEIPLTMPLGTQRDWGRAAVPFVVITMLGITALHYLTSAHFLPYHAVYRSLYYLPVAVAAVAWGVRGGLATALSMAVLYLPHAVVMSPAPAGKLLDNVLEVISLTVVAVLTGSLADAQRRQSQHIEALQVYIRDVLVSLPVGVATIEGGTALKPQNPAAITLLEGIHDGADLPGAPGYAEQIIHGRPIAIRRSVLHGTDGRLIGQVVVAEDLSEQRRLAEQVRQAERLAALGQLAGGLAHEVRNPLGIVRATAQMIARKLQDRPEVAEHLRVLTTEADRIDRLIGELLNYASPRPAHWMVFDLNHFLTEQAAAFVPLARHHNVAFSLAVPPDLPPLCADWEQLRQALLNIVLNALQASRPGQTVTLRCDSDASTVTFHIDDAGPVIPEPIRSRMFDPFFTTRDDGTGMGLAMVARIVTEHHGTIDVRQRTEGGTRVSIRLPLNQEPL